MLYAALGHVVNPRTSLRLLYFFFFATMGVYLPFFPAWLRAQGFGGTRLSLLMALLPIMNVLSPSGFGALSDWLGWRGRMLKGASAGAVLAMASLWLLLVWKEHLGFAGLLLCLGGFAFFRTPVQLMSEVIALEQGANYGRLRVWGSIAFMLTAPAAGRWLVLSPAWVLPACMCVTLLATHGVSWTLPGAKGTAGQPPLRSLGALASKAGYGRFLLVTLLGQGAHSAYELCITFHLTDLGAGADWVGLSWAMATLSEVGLMLFFSNFEEKLKPQSWLVLSLGVCVFRWVYLAQLDSVGGTFMLFQGLHAMTFALRWVVSMSLVRRFSEPGGLATSQGLFLTASSLGSALGMLVWGTLYEEAGGSTVYLSAAFVSGLTLLAALGLRPPSTSPATPL